MAGFSLGGAVNSVGGRVCDSRLTRTVIKNPIFTALLIVALVVVVLMGTYRAQITRGGGRRAARAFVYGLLAVTAVMALHNHAVRREASCSAAQQGIRDVFSSIEVSRELGPGRAPMPARDRVGGGGPGGVGVWPGRVDNVAPAREAWADFEDVEVPIRVGGRPAGPVAPSGRAEQGSADEASEASDAE